MTRAQETLTWVGPPSSAVGFAGMALEAESPQAGVAAAAEAGVTAESQPEVISSIGATAPGATAPAPATTFDVTALWDALIAADATSAIETQWRICNGAEATRLATQAVRAPVTREMLRVLFGPVYHGLVAVVP